MKDPYKRLSREWGSKRRKQEGRQRKAGLRRLSREEQEEVRPTCPNHPDRQSAGPGTNLCGPCLLGRPS